MKTKITLIIFILTYSVSAQLSFNKIYQGGDAPYANDIHMNNDTLNILSNQNFIRLNNQGNVIDNIKFSIDSAPCLGYNYATPVSFKNNTIAVTSYKPDTLCDTTWSYVSLNNVINNTKLWERKYKFDSAYSVYQATIAYQGDSNLILAGNSRKTSPGLTPFYPYCLKFDNSGNLIWLKFFNNTQGAPVSILQTTDGGSILGMNIKNIGATLLKVDNAGNVLWCKSYYRNKSRLDKVIEGENGNIYMVGAKDTTSASASYDTRSSFLIKIDSNGTPAWGIYYSQVDTITVIQDLIYNSFSNQLITIGNHGNTTYGGSYFLTYDINGYSSSLATIYLRNDYDIGVYKIQITSPNSYLIGGDARKYSPQWAAPWLFTADSNGYGICNGFTGAIGYNSFTPIDSDITVTYTTGATVVASNDIYTVGVQPFNVEDGCLYTGEQTINGATNLLVISPNPSHAVFTVALPDNANQNSSFFLSVYDAQGKLVQQQTTKMRTEKINLNLASQPTGIYNIVVTNGRVNYSGKIVLE